jgi:hypothetical protein
MGACEFEVYSTGETVHQAYLDAVGNARHEWGHGGYTGTIAEKNGFKVFDIGHMDIADFQRIIGQCIDPENKAMMDSNKAMSEEWVNKGIENFRTLAQAAGIVTAARIVEAYEDKWGPAVAIRYSENIWFFTGWASC